MAEPVPAGSSVQRLLLAVAVSLSALAILVIHRHALVVEPGGVVVHVARDAALVVASFLLAWTVLGRLSRGPPE